MDTPMRADARRSAVSFTRGGPRRRGMIGIGVRIAKASPEHADFCGLGGAPGAPATPAGVRIVVRVLPGGSLRSPPANFLSPRWGGVRNPIYESSLVLLISPH